MDKTSTLLLVCHGETDWNIIKRKQGHNDTPLNEVGRQQAEKLAQRFKDVQIDAIYASDLERAYDTAKPLASMKGMAIKKDPLLREGRWADQDQSGEYPILPYHVEVESREEVGIRMEKHLTEIARSHMGEIILLMTHGGAIREFLRRLGIEFTTDWLKRIGITEVVYDGDEFECVSLSDETL